MNIWALSFSAFIYVKPDFEQEMVENICLDHSWNPDVVLKLKVQQIM